METIPKIEGVPNIKIVLDLDVFREDYGEITDLDKSDRSAVDEARTIALNAVLGKTLFLGLGSHMDLLKENNFYEGKYLNEDLEYVMDHLSSENIQDSNLYHMNLIHTEGDLYSCVLYITLKEGFLFDLVSGDTRTRLTTFVRDALKLLFEDGEMSRDLVGYYMELALGRKDFYIAGLRELIN